MNSVSQELQVVYLSFIAICLKTIDDCNDFVIKEIDFFTKNSLQDAIPFFLFAFKFNFDLKKVKNLDQLKNYIDFTDENNLKLTNLGKDLFDYLNKKIDNHLKILKFNGIDLFDLMSSLGSMNKIYKFWHLLNK